MTPNVYRFVTALKYAWIGKLFKQSQGNHEVTTNAFLTNMESVSALLSPNSIPTTSHSRQEAQIHETCKCPHKMPSTQCI